MSEQELPTADRILLMMHNLGIVREEKSQIIDELANLTNMPSDQLVKFLRGHEDSGYVKSITDEVGLVSYFLTGKGIIRVSSALT